MQIRNKLLLWIACVYSLIIKLYLSTTRKLTKTQIHFFFFFSTANYHIEKNTGRTSWHDIAIAYVDVAIVCHYARIFTKQWKAESSSETRKVNTNSKHYDSWLLTYVVPSRCLFVKAQQLLISSEIENAHLSIIDHFKHCYCHVQQDQCSY